MDSIEFLLIIIVFAGVLSWYLHNHQSGSNGGVGLLALQNDDADCASKDPAPKSRPHAAAIAKTRMAEADTAPKPQSFRPREGARYRVREKSAAYRMKNP